MTGEEKKKLLPELFELVKHLTYELTEEDGVSDVTLDDLSREVKKALRKYGPKN